MNNEQTPGKCSWGDGITIKPDGEHELDPCVYEDVQIFRNVTVIVSRCKRCGNIIFGWSPQENTEVALDLLNDDEDDADDGIIRRTE